MEHPAYLAALEAMSLLSGIRAEALAQPVSADRLPRLELPPMEPLLPGPRGISNRIRIDRSQTNGQFSCVEYALAPRKMGPEPHLHRDLDELMYVLEGTISVLIGEQVYEVSAGSWHLRPRGILHAFWNATDQPVVALDCYFEQPFEEYLVATTRTLPELAQARGLPLNAPEIQALYNELYHQYGLVRFPEKRGELIERYGLVG